MKGLLFTYGLTYGGAFVSLFNPFIGLLIYVAFAILRPQWLWFYSVPEGNYSRIVAMGLLLGWALHGFGKWNFGKAKPMVVAIVTLQVWSIISAALIAAHKELAWDYVEIQIKIILPFVVGVTLIDSIAKLKQLAWVILLCEGYLALEFNRQYFSGVNLLREDGFGGMDNNCNAIALVTCMGLAGFLGFGAKLWWQKMIAFGAAALMAHAILFSFSRGGILAMAVTGGVAFYLIPKRPAHLLLFALALVVVIRLAGAEVQKRFATTFVEGDSRDASAESRIQLWRACIVTMVEQPFGIGPSNWGQIVSRFGFPRGKLAHTLWLQFGAELGIPGLILLVTFYGICIKRLLPLAHESTPVSDPDIHDLSRMVIAALIGFAVAAQFVSLDQLEHPFYIALIGAGLLKLTSTEAGQFPVQLRAVARIIHNAPVRHPALAAPGVSGPKVEANID